MSWRARVAYCELFGFRRVNDLSEEGDAKQAFTLTGEVWRRYRPANRELDAVGDA